MQHSHTPGIMAIDFGSAFCRAALLQKNAPPVCIPTVMPSVVYIPKQGPAVAGVTAQAQAVQDPARAVTNVKRLLGAELKALGAEANWYCFPLKADAGGYASIVADDKLYHPAAIISLLFLHLREEVEAAVGQPIREAVIAVPALFDETQRQAIRQAGRLAGLEVVRLVNGPAVAALPQARALPPGTAKQVAVYDLGAGTFEMAVLRLEHGQVKVLGTTGNLHLGSFNIDEQIVLHWARQNEIDKQTLWSNKNVLHSLLLLAQSAKEHLSQHDTYNGRFENLELYLSRAELDELAQPIIAETLSHCADALQDAGLTVGALDEVWLTGAATQLPLVQEQVGNYFNHLVQPQLHPDNATVLGAALLGSLLHEDAQHVSILDVTPLSLGIETMGGVMDVLIARNARLPVSVGHQYTTQKDGQRSMKIVVYQGERDMVRDNRRLGCFILHGIPCMPAGIPEVIVSFSLDQDGLLTVKAVEQTTGVEQQVEMHPGYGLSAEEIKDMVESSRLHAREDEVARMLVVAQSEAQQLLDAVNDFIDKHHDQLTTAEQDTLQSAMDALQRVAETDNTSEINTRIHALSRVFKPFSRQVLLN
ncbi:MAG TPA: Hsp70 family protein [Chitinophaga sp.]